MYRISEEQTDIEQKRTVGQAEQVKGTGGTVLTAPTRLERQETSKTAWYEFDGLVKYADLLMTAGFLFTVFGVFSYFGVPATLLFIGSGLMLLSYNLGKV